jgi:cysteinyl-tRNA synthetase
MSLGLLGNGFDLHCGGLDLKFPHHENERAQAVALGQEFAKHWAHNGFVMVGDEKMSKSLNNFTSLTDLLTQTDQRAYRLLVLRSHYRSPIDVTPATIADAERALERLDTFARRFDLASHDAETFMTASISATSASALALIDDVAEAMGDDLNTPLGVAKLFEAVSTANALLDQGDDEGARDLAHTIRELFAAMGLSLENFVASADAEAMELVKARDDARANKQWAEADRLRDELVSLGWICEDTPSGTAIRR